MWSDIARRQSKSPLTIVNKDPEKSKKAKHKEYPKKPLTRAGIMRISTSNMKRILSPNSSKQELKNNSGIKRGPRLCHACGSNEHIFKDCPDIKKKMRYLFVIYFL